jgi:hypothetical protein
MENKFVAAISLTAGVPQDSVVVQGVNEQRRARAVSILVASQIAVQDNNLAASVATKFNSNDLNRNLVLQGLPEGSVVSVTTSTAASANGVPQAILIAIIVIVVLVSFLIAIVILLLRRVESIEESTLRNAMQELRLRLGITPSNAFLLSTESAVTSRFNCTLFRWSRVHQETTIIQKSYLEAAARLALLMVGEFDYLNQFLNGYLTKKKFSGIRW